MPHLRFFRTSLVLCVATSILCFASAQATTSSTQVSAVVQRLLAQAPVNFAGMRGAAAKHDVYYAGFGVSSTSAKSCNRCTIVDQYAWTGSPENWYLEEDWYAKDWSGSKIASYITSQLAPKLHGYTLLASGGKDYPTYVWRNTKGMWVYTRTFNGGFTLRVGHDLAKPAHVLEAPTAADLTTLSSAIRLYVTAAAAEATNNFASLRTGAKKDELDNTAYDDIESYGSMLGHCEITDESVNTMKLDDYSPKWSMTCDTVPMVGTKAAFEGQIRAAVQNALPSGFATTTGDLLFTDDYRWDSTSTQVAVDIDSLATEISLPKGLVQFTIGVIHFLPKQ